MEQEALTIVERAYREGKDAVAAVREVWERFNDKSLAARAARSLYSASQIGRALLTLWPHPQYPVPYYYDCCW